jgi:hypothetical protein
MPIKGKRLASPRHHVVRLSLLLRVGVLSPVAFDPVLGLHEDAKITRGPWLGGIDETQVESSKKLFAWLAAQPYRRR